MNRDSNLHVYAHAHVNMPVHVHTSALNAHQDIFWPDALCWSLSFKHASAHGTAVRRLSSSTHSIIWPSKHVRQHRNILQSPGHVNQRGRTHGRTETAAAIRTVFRAVYRKTAAVLASRAVRSVRSSAVPTGCRQRDSANGG